MLAEKAAAQFKADIRDAARYRWLRDEAVWRGEPDGSGDMVWCVYGPDAYNLTPLDGADLDAAVDARLAALAAQEGKTE